MESLKDKQVANVSQFYAWRSIHQTYLCDLWKEGSDNSRKGKRLGGIIGLKQVSITLQIIGGEFFTTFPLCHRTATLSLPHSLGVLGVARSSTRL